MPSQKKQRLPHKKTVVASSIAIMLEWYDFSIFGFYAVILSRIFFPFVDETTAILSTFLVFALSLLFRPLGSIIIGSLGDRFGRKNTFILTVFLMAFPTFLIGVLPTYGQIGVTATVLLIILRVAQALSVGGERSATLSLFTELAPSHLRGLYGSISLFSTTCGIVLASAVCGLVSTHLSTEDLMTWGWRIPFLLGAVSGIAAYFLRRIIEESELFLELKEKGQVARSPLVESVKEFWRPILTVFTITIMFSVSFYLLFIYIITFAARHGGMELSQILNITTFNLAMVALILPLGAYLSDRIGRKPFLIIGCVGELIVGLFLFKIFAGDNLTMKIFIQFAGGVMNIIFAGAFAAFMVESFPTRVRMSGISMGNVIGFSVFGGSAPLVASYLISTTGNLNSPGIYMAVCAVVSLIAILRVRETYKDELK